MTVVKKVSPIQRIIIKTKKPIIVSMQPKQTVKSLEDCNIMLIGESGTGKTSLASMFNSYFVFTEPGEGELNIPFSTVYKWEDAKEIYKQIRAKKNNFASHICTDTSGSMYDLCLRYMIKVLGLKLVKDIQWGQWNDVRAEFEDEFQKLLDCGFKLISVFHMTKDDNKKDPITGMRYTDYTIRGGSQAVEYLSGRSDIILFIRYDVPHNPKERIINVRYDGNCPEKVRTKFKNKFLWRDTGEQIYSFKGGHSEEETYDILKKAFNNQLTKPKKKVWVSAKQPTKGEVR